MVGDDVNGNNVMEGGGGGMQIIEAMYTYMHHALMMIMKTNMGMN